MRNQKQYLITPADNDSDETSFNLLPVSLNSVSDTIYAFKGEDWKKPVSQRWNEPLTAEQFQKIFDYFISNGNYNLNELNIDFEILSLQRNIKILGIFARLFLRDKKQQYLNYLPRVENFVKKRLLQTQLINQDFKDFLLKYL